MTVLPVPLLVTHLCGAGAGGGSERPHREEPGGAGERRLHEERLRGRHQPRVARHRALETADSRVTRSIELGGNTQAQSSSSLLAISWIVVIGIPLIYMPPFLSYHTAYSYEGRY